MGTFITYSAKNFLGEPAMLIALVVIVGLLIQQKRFDQVIAGAIKAMVGFFLILTGTQMLDVFLSPLQPLLQKIFGMKITIVSPLDQVISHNGIAAFGVSTTLIFTGGFLINVLLARFTPLKFIHLSPHVSFFYAGLIAALLTVGTDLTRFSLVLIGSFLLGIYMTVTPAMVAPLMKHVPNGEGFTIGHSSSISIVISGYLGKVIGNKHQDLEEFKLSPRFDFLREMTISLSLIMILFFLVVTLLAGKSFVEQYVSMNRDWIIFALLQGVKFGVGMTIIITGVRMLLGEITPAFHGISDKLVPQSTPGLDVPLLFPSHPTSVIVGFLCSLFTGLLGMVVLGLLHYPVVVFPALIPTFFTGAAAAIFGNATGGRRGAVIGASLNGFILIFGQALLLPYVGEYGTVMRVLAEPDYAVYGPILGWLLTLF